MIDETAKKFAELTCSLSRECGRKEEFFARCYNLTPAELRLLMLFGERHFISIKELSTHLALTPGRITHILTSLEEKKLVSRKQDEIDKRSFNVYLTGQSRPYINKINMGHILVHKEIFDTLDETTRENVIIVMESLITAMKNWVVNETGREVTA
ncbi:MAG: MarR family transcriptional regulator [Bacteroidetes bacterium]|nr:MarR family transcriptional regulator [Bacteroidota bacterium]